MRLPFLLLLLVLSLPGLSQTTAKDVQSFLLGNGMKFLVVEDHSIPNANMYLFYKVGSRNEYPGITGLSHFFEHMMFNGTKKYGPKLFDRKMEFHGGSNNAYTSQNVTVYQDWFPSSVLEVIFDLESDRLANLSIDDKMIESERGVVLSERSTGLENSPWVSLLNGVYATAFQEHSYHWPEIGYESDIKSWTKADLENYFHTYYSPSNCVVVISGNVKVEEVEKLANKYFANIFGGKTIKELHLVEPPQTGERRIVVQREVSAPYYLIGYHTPETRHKDFYPLTLLSSILSQGNSSRLYSTLVDQKQLATNVFTEFGESFDPNLFLIYCLAEKDVKESDLEKAVFDEIEKIKKDGISEKELQKVKNQKLMEFYKQIETIDGKSNNIGTYELFFGDYRKMFDAPKEYEKVTVDDIKRVANEYFKKFNRTIGIAKTKVEE